VQELKQGMMQGEALRKFAGKGMLFKKTIDRNCRLTECSKSGNS